MWDDALGCCAYAAFESLFWGPWSWVVYGLLLIVAGIWMLFQPDLQGIGVALIAGGVLILAVGGYYSRRHRDDI